MAKDKELEVKEKAAKPAKIKKEKPAKEKKPRAKKAAKTVEADKLPKLFKKNYSEKKFEKKILRKIFIDSDKKLIQSIFEKQTDDKGNTVYAVDLTKPIEAKDAQRLKIVAKQIKKQKGAFKLVPLLATIIFLVAVGVVVTMFKNVIVKKAIVSTMQGVFQAETNIDKVDFQIFGASLDIKNLQQTNKDNPKTNLVQIDNISMDFNLADLLKGKFHAEKVAVEGVALGTERAKEGRLIEKKAKEEKKQESQIAANTKQLAGAAAEKLKNMFAAYNPETMIKEVQDQLKSPALAKTVAEDVQKQVAKWQETPAKIEKQVNDFSGNVQKVMNTDWSNVKDLNSLKEALETVNTAITQGQTLSDSISGTANDLKSDSTKVVSYGTDIKNAIEADKKLIDDKVAEVTHLLSKEGFTEVMNDAIQSMLYDITGKYYPYVNKLMDFAKTTAGNGANKPKKEKQKKQKKARLPGRTVYYRADKTPKFWVNEVIASGYEKGSDKLLFSGNAKNITSDQNLIDKNTTLDASFNILGRANSASAVMDTRENATSPFLSGNYNGSGYPVSANAEVFNITSTSDITAMITADKTGAFNVGGILDMKVSEMTGMDFEPAKLCTIYKNSLAGIKDLTLGFGIGMDENGDLTVEIKNPEKLARQIVDPVVAALSKEATAMAASAKEDAVKMLSEKTGIANEKIAQFTDISTAVGASQDKIGEMQRQLEAKKKEITDQITAKTKGAATDAAKDALKKSGVDTNSAKDALGGLKKLKF